MISMPNYIDNNLMSGRFAEKSEIMERCQKTNLGLRKKSNASGMPVIPDLKNGIIYTDNTDTNSLVISSTGTGKTRRLLIPQLVSIAYERNSSVICNDPKGELYSNTSGLFMRKGYDVKVLNFRQCMSGDTYNPLQKIAELYKNGEKAKSVEMIQAFCGTLFSSLHSEKDPFWERSAASYMTGLCILLCQLYNKSEDVNLYNLYNLHIMGDEKYGVGRIINSFCDMGEVDELAYKFMSCAINASNDTRASIYAVFTTALSSIVNNMDVVDMTSSSTFNIEDFVENKTILYIISRDESRVYDGLVTGIIDQFYYLLIDISDRFEGVIPRRIEIIVEEMSNLSRINDFDRKISASRARNIRWTLCTQSKEQLSVIYGKEIAKIIISNCNNIFYLYSPDIELLKYLSTRCGNRADNIRGKEEPLLSIDQLQRFAEGECLVLLGNLNPYVTILPDCSEYPLTERRTLNMKKRKKTNIYTKDIKNMVIAYKRKLAQNEDTDDIIKRIFDDESPVDFHEEIDMLIKKIDKQIEELEEEEKKSN